MGRDLSLVRFGTSSFSSKDWIGPFYPPGTAPKDFFASTPGRLDTVEIDATYYAVPTLRTVEGWAAKTPPDFLISAKFPRDIVHGGSGRTPNPARILDPDLTYPIRDEFLGVMRALGERLGPLVIQFPFFGNHLFAAPGPFMEKLDRFLGDLPEGFTYVVEIRNRSWLNADFAALCRRHRASMVLVDQAWMPHGDEVEREFDPLTGEVCYVRLLGDRPEIEAITTTWEREVIDREERLLRWARFLARVWEREVPTLVYVNNHYAGHAPATVERLRTRFLEAVGLKPRD